MASRKELIYIERGFIIGPWMIGNSVTEIAQLASVSIGRIIKVASAFRSMSKDLIKEWYTSEYLILTVRFCGGSLTDGHCKSMKLFSLITLLYEETFLSFWE